jgi:hypothetical protein
MNAASASQTGKTRVVWISRLAAIVGVVALLFVFPLGYRPWYYIALATIGLVPLLCGPALYRWLGTAFIVALASAVQQYRAGLAMEGQLEQIRAESRAHQTNQAMQLTARKSAGALSLCTFG